MKKIVICMLLLVATSFSSAAFAYQYTEEQKSAIYDMFIATYLSTINQQIQAYPIPADKKQQIINFTKHNVNKQQLINETWGCLSSKEPNDQQGINSCFVPWARKQSADLTEFMMRMQ